MSSKMEGLPISLLEAMSLGVIPVSTPAGGVCDVIRNGENGYISSSHTPEDFYRIVKDAIANIGNVSSKEFKMSIKQNIQWLLVRKNILICIKNHFKGKKFWLEMPETIFHVPNPLYL